MQARRCPQVFSGYVHDHLTSLFTPSVYLLVWQSVLYISILFLPALFSQLSNSFACRLEAPLEPLSPSLALESLSLQTPSFMELLSIEVDGHTIPDTLQLQKLESPLEVCVPADSYRASCSRYAANIHLRLVHNDVLVIGEFALF